ncbi:hypothetical protein BBP40_001918 [Aspergillus hancockii]|nr:hypothetical protein BBP40_001918 [Aspergillus hancockii]
MTILASQHHALVNTILNADFGLQPESSTLNEIEQAKNNHVYLIQQNHDIAEPLLARDGTPKPYTSAIPVETSKLTLRVSKNNVSVEESVRIHNEGAFLTLARDALSSMDTSLTPLVFRRDEATPISSSDFCWILDEHREGAVLSVSEILALDAETVHGASSDSWGCQVSTGIPTS